MANNNQKWVPEESYDPSLSQVRETPPEVVESIYRVKVTEAIRSPTKEGRPQIQCEFKLEEDIVRQEEARGRVKFHRVLITSGVAGFGLKQLVSATGVDAPADQSPETIDAYCNTILGAVAYARVYPKKDKNSGMSFPAIRQLMSEELALEKAQEFADKMANGE